MIARPEIVMYTTKWCPYCMMARSLLENKGANYREIQVDGDPDRWSEMERISGRYTVPQIFIGDHHVGGYDDLATLERSGQLEPMLLGVSNQGRA